MAQIPRGVAVVPDPAPLTNTFASFQQLQQGDRRLDLLENEMSIQDAYRNRALDEQVRQNDQRIALQRDQYRLNKRQVDSLEQARQDQEDYQLIDTAFNFFGMNTEEGVKMGNSILNGPGLEKFRQKTGFKDIEFKSVNKETYETTLNVTRNGEEGILLISPTGNHRFISGYGKPKDKPTTVEQLAVQGMMAVGQGKMPDMGQLMAMGEKYRQLDQKATREAVRLVLSSPILGLEGPEAMVSALQQILADMDDGSSAEIAIRQIESAKKQQKNLVGPPPAAPPAPPPEGQMADSPFNDDTIFSQSLVEPVVLQDAQDRPFYDYQSFEAYLLEVFDNSDPAAVREKAREKWQEFVSKNRRGQ